MFEFCVFSHSFLLIISFGLFLLVNTCNITCDDIVSNIWSIYMYVLCILGSKRIVWFIYLYVHLWYRRNSCTAIDNLNLYIIQYLTNCIP